MDEAAEVDPAPFDAVLARATPEQWAELAAALAGLEASGPPYADWSPQRRSDSGVLTLPYPTYRPAAERLRRAAGAFVVVFPWPDWRGGERYAEPSALADAPVHDALRLVTRALRGERFSDGHLESELDAGLLQAAVKRLLDARPTPG